MFTFFQQLHGIIPMRGHTKDLWIAKYFDEKLIRKRLILCHHKQLMIGDYLIDDRRFNGASEFKGKWIHFGSEDFPNWE